jgi:hypothetical protein
MGSDLWYSYHFCTLRSPCWAQGLLIYSETAFDICFAIH